MAGTTLKDLADRLIDGGLEPWLRRRKVTEQQSLGSIARLLERDHEIVVTPETVRNWCSEYGIPTGRPGVPEPQDAA